MGAAQAFSDRFLPKQSFSRRTLRECSSRKKDNIVLIEVDSDDFGDVIILDVPESFEKRFRNKPRHVISIDGDDDGDGNDNGDDGENEDGVHNSNSDSSTSDRCPSAEAAHPSTSAYAEKDIDEGITPVKLSKSKRTYSGKSIYRNRYGLSPDFEGFSSDSDCSDCELVEGSLGKLREQWEKASFRKRHDAGYIIPDFEDKAGTSAPSPEEGAAEDVELHGEQSNVRKCSLHHERDYVVADSPQKFSKGSNDLKQDYDPMEVDVQLTRTHDGCTSSDLDEKERGGTWGPQCPVHYIAEQCAVKNSEPVGDLNDLAGKLAEQFKFPQQDSDAERTNEVYNKGNSADIFNQPSQEAESCHAALFDRKHGAGIPSMPSGRNLSCSHADEAVSYSDPNNIITDRQKIKETEEYKHAMEEELAARQQQLLVQAEEARRLRNRKRAESMRIMMNERRQKQRVEEIRQTRRKDEENLNLKERYRAEIKKELHKIEAICTDMASLLRCLGIHVGGGLYPSPNEVQAAYKRACLKFHPDRMSTTDLQQQVEAEEKFKLISNMKDKFFPK